ncbi:MAG: MBL fold metallo-hydrolase [Candidatus Magasanikbacteria bacterium]|nr:MBL fold metallo-hydrolase [Candidatus Magasanikbacteria bacterium]
MKKYAIPIVLFLILCTLGMLAHISFDGEKKIQDGDTVFLEGSNALRVAYLDVGQGDATFITFPNNQQMLIDCAVDGRILEALGREMPFHDKTIDYLLITHPDKDHYGGCIDVLKRFDVDHIVYSGVKKDHVFFHTFENAMFEEGAQYHQVVGEHVWHIASTTLHFLYPDHNLEDNHFLPGAKKDTGYNNTSIVFSLEYAGKTFLFTGDAESELEEYLLSKYGQELDVDVLKAGHHGSGGSSVQAFIEKVTPIHTIFSAGKQNTYGHPSPRIMNRVARVGSEIWRTDLQSDILVYILSSEKYYVTSTRTSSF